MAKYIITYLGGNHPSNPDEQKKHFGEYMNWLNSIGDLVVSPANPLRNTKTINPDKTVSEKSVTKMSGYTIIESDSMDEAISIAKNCPFLEIDGTLEVSELIKMPM